MSENEKKKLKLPHWLPFTASLLGVIALMALYLVFIARNFGQTGSQQENFENFIAYIETCKDDITELTELELSKLGDNDTKSYFITPDGDEKELRGRVFEGAYMAETSISSSTGNRCATYYYMWYDIDCVVIFEKGNASAHTDGSDLSAVMTDSIAAAVNGHQKE